MLKRAFTEQSITPNDTLIGNLLGAKIDLYMTIMNTSNGLNRRWQFIQGNGWLLKVDENEKPLYYLIACENGIIVNLTVNDNELNTMISNKKVSNIQSEINHATKYFGGYAISFEIDSLQHSRIVAKFLSDHIINRRTAREKVKKPSLGKA